MHAFHSSHSYFASSPFFLFSLFIFSIFLCSLLIWFFYVSCYSSFFFTVHGYDLCILPIVIKFTILPLNHFWLVMGVLHGLPTGLLATQQPPLPCAGCATLHSQKKVILFCFLASRGILIQIKARFLSY